MTTTLHVPPCAEGQVAERLFTGERIEPDEGTSGKSRLTITNGTKYDAAVRLLDYATERTTRLIYIRAGSAYDIPNIEPGTYSLFFTTGTDWIPNCLGFLRDADFVEFEEPVVFNTRTEEDGDIIRTRADHWGATLHPVKGGTAKTRAIDRKRFYRGDQHVALAQ